jgi:hypothetical protein
MTNTTDSNKDFATFAAEFRQDNPEMLKMWQNHPDPLRRAVAQIICEEAGA